MPWLVGLAGVAVVGLFAFGWSVEKVEDLAVTTDSLALPYVLAGIAALFLLLQLKRAG